MLVAKMKLRLTYLCVIILVAVSFQVLAAEKPAAYSYFTTFEEGKWDKSAWIELGTPYSKTHGEWVQNKDNVSNVLPKGAASIKDVLWAREYEVYTSMYYNHKLTGDSEVYSTMSWDDAQAPLIFITEEPEKQKEGLALPHKYYEVVLYYKGINVWQHTYINGKQDNKKVAWCEFKSEPLTKYKLEISITKQNLFIKVGDRNLGCAVPDLSKEYYVGITACEGINRFYDFGVEQS
jgi:hypothetical protein